MSRLKTTILLVVMLPLVMSGCVSEPGPRTAAKTTPSNFGTLMPPQSLLREDTIEAASHDRSSSRLAYVGVWAPTGDHCAMMDQTAFEGFAVITPGSIRQSGLSCSFEPGVTGQGYLQFEASCKVKRKTRKRTITILMANSAAMTLGIDGESRNMTRCHLPR